MSKDLVDRGYILDSDVEVLKGMEIEVIREIAKHKGIQVSTRSGYIGKDKVISAINISDISSSNF